MANIVASTSVDSMHSLLQKQIDATQSILRAQKELFTIQCQMQSMWSDVAFHESKKQETVSMPSEESRDSPENIAESDDEMAAIPCVQGVNVALEAKDELPGQENGTWCKVYARTLLDPVAQIFPSSCWNRFDLIFEALPSHKLKDLMDETLGIFSPFNMLIFTAVIPWFAGWNRRPETVAELLLYEFLFVATISNFCAVPTATVLHFTVRLPHISNLHAWLIANRFFFKIEAILRCMFSWSFILCLILKPAMDVCGDELPYFLSAKIADSTRVAVSLFNVFLVVGTIVLLIAAFNISYYTAIYSGVLCHTPLLLPQELARDGGVSKLLSATLAGLKMGTTRLHLDYQRNRHKEEKHHSEVKEFKNPIRRPKTLVANRRQRVESDDAFCTVLPKGPLNL